jgi:abhydrolase domain-containing protein 12
VTPFSLKTPDGESIYAWHILPLPLYLKNEATIEAQEPGFSHDFTKTESFRLLKEDPESRLVLYCKLINLQCSCFVTAYIYLSSWCK